MGSNFVGKHLKKRILKGRARLSGIDWAGSGYVPEAGSYRHANESLASTPFPIHCSLISYITVWATLCLKHLGSHVIPWAENLAEEQSRVFTEMSGMAISFLTYAENLIWYVPNAPITVAARSKSWTDGLIPRPNSPTVCVKRSRNWKAAKAQQSAV
jgi:hypothetical protein